jgi:hypothetical protein
VTEGKNKKEILSKKAKNKQGMNLDKKGVWIWIGCCGGMKDVSPLQMIEFPAGHPKSDHFRRFRML